MSRGSVLVVGGGIGGLSTAIALGNVGYDVNVVELREDLHSSVYGVGIIQPVNALRALEAIGCAEACMEAGYSTTAWGQVLDVEGNLVREMPGARIPGSDLPPMNGLTRPQLHKILTSRAREVGVTIEYGKTFTPPASTADGTAPAPRSTAQNSLPKSSATASDDQLTHPHDFIAATADTLNANAYPIRLVT
jgi:2-polyprenyl-6-methoxyphenol hydroxylase-like FAD-dependent oxidoreductase